MSDMYVDYEFKETDYPRYKFQRCFKKMNKVVAEYSRVHCRDRLVGAAEADMIFPSAAAADKRMDDLQRAEDAAEATWLAATKQMQAEFRLWQEAVFHRCVHKKRRRIQSADVEGFENLAPLILQHIGMYLDMRSLLAMAFTCKTWHDFLTDPQVVVYILRGWETRFGVDLFLAIDATTALERTETNFLGKIAKILGFATSTVFLQTGKGISEVHISNRKMEVDSFVRPATTSLPDSVVWMVYYDGDQFLYQEKITSRVMRIHLKKLPIIVFTNTRCLLFYLDEFRIVDATRGAPTVYIPFKSSIIPHVEIVTFGEMVVLCFFDQKLFYVFDYSTSHLWPVNFNPETQISKRVDVSLLFSPALWESNPYNVKIFDLKEYFSDVQPANNVLIHDNSIWISPITKNIHFRYFITDPAGNSNGYTSVTQSTRTIGFHRSGYLIVENNISFHEGGPIEHYMKVEPSIVTIKEKPEKVNANASRQNSKKCIIKSENILYTMDISFSYYVIMNTLLIGHPTYFLNSNGHSHHYHLCLQKLQRKSSYKDPRVCKGIPFDCNHNARHVEYDQNDKKRIIYYDGSCLLNDRVYYSTKHQTVNIHGRNQAISRVPIFFLYATECRLAFQDFFKK